MTQKTRTIAGHEITLTVGGRHRATRPMASTGAMVFPVAIRERTLDDERGWAWESRCVIGGLSLGQANDLINAFNNGETSFDGRVW